MRPADILSSALLFAAASSAWPSLYQPFKAVKRELEPLIEARQQKTTFDLSFSATEGQTDAQSSTSDDSSATTTDGSATTTGDTKATGTNTNSAQSSGKDSTITSGGKNTATATKKGDGTSTQGTTKSFDQRLPAGGVSMITPGALAGTKYYKIHDYVTFAWNYTSLMVTPTAIDILASCAANDATYTIALNQSISGPTGAITWDTGAYQATATLPLLTEKYTLIIYDAQKSVAATPSPGYLGTFSQFTFGMYTPQPYTPMADWVCATCNGAITSMEKHTLGFLFGMATITVLSFGWFGGVAGLW